MNDLLPCPFCGSPGEIYQDGDGDYEVCCSGQHDAEPRCCVAFSVWRYPLLADAVKAWNTRTPAVSLAGGFERGAMNRQSPLINGWLELPLVAPTETVQAPLTVSGPQTATEPQTPLETRGEEI